jgi:Ca-activated chloride channel family protein
MRHLFVTLLLLGLSLGPARAQQAPEVQEMPDAAAYVAPMITRDPDACLSEVRVARGDLPGQVAAPEPEAPPLRRLVIAIDASGSMAGNAGGRQKMEGARRAALDFLRTVPRDVEVGLVVFGHRGNARREGRAESCAAVETQVRPDAASRDAAREAIGRLRPVGWTPLAAAIEEAGRLFPPATAERPGEHVLLVVSDGVETCGGDPVEAARRLHGGPVRLVVDIVGFDIAERERAALAAVAEAGGGRFENARDATELARQMQQLRLENARRATTARIGAARDATQTRIAVARAVTRARICMGNLMTRESIDVSNRLTRDSIDGAVTPAFGREVRSLLTERHAAIRRTLDDYVSAVEGMRDAEIEGIEAELRRALAPPSR